MTDRYQLIYNYIVAEYKKNGETPNKSQIARVLRISRTTVIAGMRYLIKNGYLAVEIRDIPTEIIIPRLK